MPSSFASVGGNKAICWRDRFVAKAEEIFVIGVVQEIHAVAESWYIAPLPTGMAI